MSGEHRETAPSETALSATDLLELDILALLQTVEANEAFDRYAHVMTEQTAPSFAELLRTVNTLAVGGDFEAAVDAEVFAAVRCPHDISRLERFGVFTSPDAMFKLGALRLLRTMQDSDTQTPSPDTGAPDTGPRDVR
ncbi:MAG: hypothetical protein U5N21_14550 [Rhodococcus sp. (in: high G+C Gram-positive bacteria)]|nr:hypothetical protein [Rhodococcus sp. (in: high G+C Gram-positive bacteria)]